jgi:hypothetical protein
VNQMQQESPAPYSEVVEIRVTSDAGSARVSGALLGDEHERIVGVDDYTVSVSPRGTLLVLRNADVAQVMGHVGTVLAGAGHFVDEYQQARRSGGGEVPSLIRIDRPASDAVMGNCGRRRRQAGADGNPRHQASGNSCGIENETATGTRFSPLVPAADA